MIPVDPDTLRALIDGRSLYLWGAAQTGIGMFQALARVGIETAGFIDRRSELWGRELLGCVIVGPREVLDGFADADRKPFIIPTTFQHQDTIAATCERAGLVDGRDFLADSAINPLNYQVVVASVCNLRCISCPLGNRPRQSAGLMAARTYRQVLDKILVENPMVGMVQLYNWGEPLLNPELAEIIRITGNRSVLCAVSSNLDVRHDFEDVVAARPGIFRISVSGTGETYALTHTGGRWNRVEANMRRLASYRSRHCPDLPVEVTYHLYRHNSGIPSAQVEALCRELGFTFRAHLAALLPLDNVVDVARGEPLGEEAQRAAQMLAMPIEQALSQAAAQRDRPCAMDHAVNIEWDLSVKHCGLYYGPEDNRVTDNYLELPLEAFLLRRRDSRLCRRCKGRGLHRFCAIYTDQDGSSRGRNPRESR